MEPPDGGSCAQLPPVGKGGAGDSPSSDRPTSVTLRYPLGDSMEYRFKADEWNNLTPQQRIHRCRLMAAEAQELANGASLKTKEDYLALAKNWLQLARDIEETNGESGLS